MKLRVLICEDDAVILKTNQAMIEACSEAMKKDVETFLFRSVNEELNRLIESGTIDIAVLDIDLINGNGWTVAEQLQAKRPNIPIIFITKHEEKKADAWDRMAFGFLSKPVHIDKFENFYERAVILAEENKNRENEVFLHIMENRQPYDIPVVDIISLEKVQRKVIIKSEQGKFEVNDSLISLEEKLLPFFFRLNQGVIVNLKKVDHRSKHQIVLVTGDTYDIGGTYMKQVNAVLKARADSWSSIYKR